jgi:hypothetical protein
LTPLLFWSRQRFEQRRFIRMDTHEYRRTKRKRIHYNSSLTPLLPLAIDTLIRQALTPFVRIYRYAWVREAIIDTLEKALKTARLRCIGGPVAEIVRKSDTGRRRFSKPSPSATRPSLHQALTTRRSHPALTPLSGLRIQSSRSYKPWHGTQKCQRRLAHCSHGSR